MFWLILAKKSLVRYNIPMKIIAKNKRAFFDYDIQEQLDAGIVLFGHEVKSVKSGHISLKGSHVTIHNNEAWLTNATISAYKQAGNLEGYDPTRTRKLLLHSKEIKRMIGQKTERGASIIPVEVYVAKNLVKVRIGIGVGKKEYDKREKIKKRDEERSLRRFSRGKK